MLVLGTIHGKHRTSELYDLKVLEQIIRKVAPDAILAEIPPKRMPIAMKQFQQHDSIWEPRVVRFPEYVDVIFPLTKEMNLEIIPTAGWTAKMAQARRKRMQEIKNDSAWADQWREYRQASKKSDSLVKAWGGEDPAFIHSGKYDEAVEVWAEPYNRLFNEELGPGGWDNINEAHYNNIVRAIEDPDNKGKRLLITYGAGHKGWFLKQLKKRKDIQLLDISDFLP